MDTRDRTRRWILGASAFVIATAVAGCVGGDGDGPSPTDASPTPTATDDQGGVDTETDDGADDGTGTREDSAGSSDTMEVAMRVVDGEYHFDPRVTLVDPGGTVTFVVESGSHSATAYAPANDRVRRIPEDGTAFDSGVMADGETHEVTIETPGVYDFYCEPHEANGMVGTLLVGQPDPDGQPGLAEPSELPEATHEVMRTHNQIVRNLLGGGDEPAAGGEDDAAGNQTDDGHEGNETHADNESQGADST